MLAGYFFRYKKMMHQSKLNYARITSNHEMEKELRSQTTMRFNTNLGADDHDEMLKRTWDYGRRKRGCINDGTLALSSSSSSGKATRARSAPAKTAAYRIKRKGKAQEKKDFVAAPLSQDSGISLDGLEPVLDEDSDVFERSVSLEKAPMKQRPATASLAHRQVSRQQTPRDMEPRLERDVISRVASANDSVTGQGRVRKTYAKDIPKIALSGSAPTVVEVERATESDYSEPTKVQGTNQKDTNGEPQPTGQFLETYLAETDQSKPASSKTSTASAPPNNFKEFVQAVASKEPGGRPNLLDIQKVRVRVADFDNKVKDFNSKVANLKAPSSAITDYYTSRAMDVPARKYTSTATLDKPSEKEIRRETGNTKLKCITFKTLDMNY